MLVYQRVSFKSKMILLHLSGVFSLMNSPWIFRTIQDESEKNNPLYTHHDLRCRIDDLLFFVGMIIYMLMLLFGTHNNEIKLHVQQMPRIQTIWWLDWDIPKCSTFCMNKAWDSIFFVHFKWPTGPTGLFYYSKWPVYQLHGGLQIQDHKGFELVVHKKSAMTSGAYRVSWPEEKSRMWLTDKKNNSNHLSKPISNLEFKHCSGQIKIYIT